LPERSSSRTKYAYNQKLEKNHEVMFDELIESANTIINFCSYPATVVSKEELDLYNK